MDLKFILLVAFVLALMVDHQVEAGFVGFIDNFPLKEEFEERGLVCAPGRTIIKIKEKVAPLKVLDSGDEDEEIYNSRRTHMNTNIHEEYCQMCVCSVEGKDEYCSGRPAANVNECIRMSKIMEDFNKHEPFDHTRDLAQRIRRDYIWHNDEIPYDSKAKCRRGHSYYSNSLNANDTDIDVASDVESLLDYSNKSICFYCVCSPDGWGVGCINRKAWYCEYYRKLRVKGYPREMYKNLFQQDRPSYFRQLSWRLRRTMDTGLYDFATAVGGDNNAKDQACVPFVSEYTNCNAENQCSGCTKCMCILGGQWSCETVHKCSEEDTEDVDYNTIDTAMNQIQESLYNYNKNEAAKSKTPYVPQPSHRDEELLLDNYAKDLDLDMNIASLLRNKRSTGKSNSTNGVKFYHTVDEINEDTLKNGNISGTLQAHKVGVVKAAKVSRRTGLLTSGNNSSPLHITHNEHKAYDPHIADNKIDAEHQDEKYDTISRNKMNAVFGNRAQKQKDKDLSKLIVNELKPGEEVIGDKNSKIMSNITFTPENDTLTAMAFIAGNLLNKLWNMEKDSGEDSMETEVLKHEKIADLIDLFKEPLNLRQENFLKNALEHLSGAIDKDKNLKNVSLCKKIEEANNLLSAANSSSEETTAGKQVHINLEKVVRNRSNQGKNFKAPTEAITKIISVLSLINEFQEVQKNLHDLKRQSTHGSEYLKMKSYVEIPEFSKKNDLSGDEPSSVNVFGNIIEKLTKLLLPPKKNKKMSKNIRNLNLLRDSKDIARKIKSLYNIDINSSDLSPKDQIILDYLSTVKRNPKCILDNLRDSDTKSMTKIEGDILLNLSEFFKVKSFVDLMKVVEPETKTAVRTKDTTTETQKATTVTSTITTSTTTEAANKLRETKEKLKLHLKTIIDDLIELQNAKGHPSNNFSIADALPCIFNILNADKTTQNQQLPGNKVAEIFNALKQELALAPTRRSQTSTGRRPKAASVWERMFKNYDNLSKLGQNRRSMDVKEPKTFEELKKLMDYSESGSKTYKSLALLNGVPPSERLMLLKTLSEDVRQYISVLEEINTSLSNFNSWSVDEKNDVKDFIDNANTNINLNVNIAKNINNLKVKSNNLLENKAKVVKKPKENYTQMQSMKYLNIHPSYEGTNPKVTRDSIINQLIKNRMQLYIKLKETENVDLENDINYSIAKKVLTYLEIGNYTLARELYKIIVAQKQKANQQNNQQVKSTAEKVSPFGKVPVVQFEEPRGQSQLQWLNQDMWLKQLANLKSMRA